MRVEKTKVTAGPLIVGDSLLSLAALFLASLYLYRGVHLVAGTALELRARGHLPA